MRNVTTEISDGGYYAAAQSLKHTVTSPPESSLDFTVQICSDTFVKRVLKGTDGNITLLLNDLSDIVKKNKFEFKPFSDFVLDEFEEMDISYTSNSVPVSLSIKVVNAIVTPDSFINSGDFITRKSEFILDKRFETGANFFGELEIEFTVEDGSSGTAIVGRSGEISYLSFRTISVLPDGLYEGKAVEFPCYDITSSAILTGFPPGELSGKKAVNQGTASVSVVDNHITIGSGSVYGLYVTDQFIITTPIPIYYEFPMCESNANGEPVFDIVNGGLFYLIGEKTVITQDDYTALHDYGFQVVTTVEDSETYVVCRKTDKSKIIEI